MPSPNIFQRPAPRVVPKQDPLVGFQVRRALMLHQAGQVDEAVAIYEKILREDPHQFQSLHFMAVAHIQGGRHAEALPLLERALALRPGMAELLKLQNGSLRALEALRAP
jgi:tetratricopeptide (TPR) repeat protein